MNKKGQIFVSFILLLPLIIMFLAYVIDNGIILEQKNKLNELTKTVILYGLNNRDKTKIELEEYIRKNEPNISNVQIILDEDIQIEITKEIDAIFGKIIGFKKYKISSYYQGQLLDGKTKILEVKK